MIYLPASGGCRLSQRWTQRRHRISKAAHRQWRLRSTLKRPRLKPINVSTRLYLHRRIGRMARSKRPSQQRIGDNSHKHKNWDHDWRHEVSHGFLFFKHGHCISSLLDHGSK